MTRDEMILQGRLFMDKVHSDSYPELSKREWDVFLNESQNRFYKLRYGRNNIYGKGYEESQKRREDNKNITSIKFLKEVNGVFDTTVTYFDEECLLPTDEVYAIYLGGQVKTLSCKVWEPVDVVDHDSFRELEKDPFNKPEEDSPVAVFIQEGILIEPHVEAFQVTYLRIPKDISETQDCELSEHTHKEIVQLAVNLVIESIESPRIQTHGLNNIE